MNRLTSWFYKKEERNTLALLEKEGLRVEDEEKFSKKIMAQARGRIIYTVILCLLIFLLIWKWVGA